MTIMAVICTAQGCRHQYHQDVNLTQRITVHACRNCGAAGRMIMGPGRVDIVGLPAQPFTRPPFPWPLLRLPVNAPLLTASADDLQRLHLSLAAAGYVLVGFHGCGANAASSILSGVRDVSTTNARGRGFCVGNKYDGIPGIWAHQAKGGGTPTILRIYVRHWTALLPDVDYVWGKMDPDDDVEEDGLECVLKVHTFARIFALPSQSASDEHMIAASIWAACPTHSFRSEEIPNMTRIAEYLRVSLDEIERRIEDGDLEAIMEAAKWLGIKIE